MICNKCSYYNKFKNKCYNFGVIGSEECKKYEMMEKRLTEEEIKNMSIEDLIEQYQANLRYSNDWENGEAYNDYVWPLKQELKRRLLI